MSVRSNASWALKISDVKYAAADHLRFRVRRHQHSCGEYVCAEAGTPGFEIFRGMFKWIYVDTYH
ncbi:MAG: hypothetical protein OXF33_15160 [Rhodospirillales bacterium]|nr:hypothetical protein [Rhodospirillales bacterium]MCY4005032.1 hypothetical protein [Rhodospirillales bacterium]